MFTGNEDQSISLETGSTLTANFRNWLDTSGSEDPTIGEYFSRAHLEALLAQQNAVGIRVYYGMNEDGNRTLVTVAVDANEDDLYQGLIGDRSFKSPPRAGADNSLNS